MEVQTYKQIKENLINNFIASQNKVTDLNEGSVIDSLFDSFAREEEKKYIATKLGFTNNLKLIPYSLFGFSKKEGSYAQSKVIFSRSDPKSFDTVIPSGTIVTTGMYEYETTESATILADTTDSPAVNVRAVEKGVEYNVDVGAINTISSNVSSDVVRVTNNVMATGGTGEESDSEIFGRFKTYLNGLQGTSLYGLKSAVESIDGVRSVGITEDFSAGAVYRVMVYAEDGSGTLKEEIKNAIIDVIEGDGSPENPGKRAPGINVLVSAPSIVNADLEMKVTTERVDLGSATSEIQKCVNDYINNLIIGDDLILSSLILEVRKLSFVTDCKILSPADNINIGQNQILKLGQLELDVE